MIDSLINRMPHSDNNGLPAVRGGGGGGKRRATSSKWPSSDRDVPPCKKRKKIHKWPKKSRRRDVDRSKCKAKKRIRTKPEAPFNSTQFIMDEHDNLNDSDLSTSRRPRHRDSSLSMESEDLEDEVYSSPEDEEEEFMTRQFWSAYEDYHAERLDAMSKSQLVQEYFALEEKLTLLERELRAAREQDRRRIREPSPIDDEDEEEVVPGEVPVDAETAAKIEIFRNEIQKLEVENERLRQENGLLRRKQSCRRCSTTNNSSDSSSTSDSGSGNATESDDATTTYSFKRPESSLLVGHERIVSDEELEISETVLKGDQCYGPDSGIASSEGGVSCASSGEDVKVENVVVTRSKISNDATDSSETLRQT